MFRDIFRYSYLADIYKLHKMHAMKREWRRINKHNLTVPETIFDTKKVKVGNYTYGRLNVIEFGNNHMLEIGNFVSIADNVTFLLDAEHYTHNISTYPFKVNVIKEECNEAYGKGDIIVADDVWIGYGATIFSGVKIAQGAIVAAGALVTKDVPPYSVVAGVPAKVIKYRFDSGEIEELLKIDYSKITEQIIRTHINELYTELDGKMKLDWLPQKKHDKMEKNIL